MDYNECIKCRVEDPAYGGKISKYVCPNCMSKHKEDEIIRHDRELDYLMSAEEIEYD